MTDEKDSGFLSVARVLRICIDLTECRLGMVSVFNTEQRKSELGSTVDELLKRGSCKKVSFPPYGGGFVCGEPDLREALQQADESPFRLC